MLSNNDYTHLVLLEPPSKRRVLLCVGTESHFGREVLSGILQYHQENLLWRIEICSPKQYNKELLENFCPEALIIATEELDQIENLDFGDLPTVHVLPKRFSSEVPSICMDDDDLGVMAADFLFSRSPSAYVFARNTGEQGLRETSFLGRLEELGISPEQCCSVNPHREELLEALRQKKSTVGLYAGTDALGLLVINWLVDEGISVPQKVLVLGTGDDPLFCNACTPSLSSIHLRYSQSGYDAAKNLNSLIENDEIDGRLKFIIPKMIHERESTTMFNAIDPRLMRSMQYYLEHMELGQNVEEVCRLSELSYRSFHRLFKESLGLSPKSWMEKEQFKRAKNLLENSREKLSVVAQKCGYSDDKALIRSFRRMGRHNPSHYRNSTTTLIK